MIPNPGRRCMPQSASAQERARGDRRVAAASLSSTPTAVDLYPPPLLSPRCRHQHRCHQTSDCSKSDTTVSSVSIRNPLNFKMRMDLPCLSREVPRASTPHTTSGIRTNSQRQSKNQSLRCTTEPTTQRVKNLRLRRTLWAT